MRTITVKALILAALALGVAHGAEEHEPPFPVRIIEIGGSMASAELYDNLEFYTSIGFNSLLVSSGFAGQWNSTAPGYKPVLDPAFLELSRLCSERGIGIVVALDPVRDSGGSFMFSDPRHEKRLRRFVKALHRKAGVRDFVLSFRNAPPRLSDLRDIVRYGLIAAPAHIDLSARIGRRLGKAGRLWLLPVTYSDSHLDHPGLRYSAALIEGLEELDREIGVVWSGPAPLSPSVTRASVVAVRERLGGRAVMLHDGFSIGGGENTINLAISLTPLQNRDPAIAGEIAAYLFRPMSHNGGSRLTLLTVTDFLRNPGGYDRDGSLQSAINRLAGDDPEVRDALKTQIMEWGGWIGERNYRNILTDSPVAAAKLLRDPARVSLWKWTALRYPQRMRVLEGLADHVFRDDLLEVMARRLAVARAMPTVREIRARIAVGRQDTDRLVEQLEDERSRVAGSPGVLAALDRFLAAAGIQELLGDQPDR
jgi:hypothetical protein